MNIPNLMFDSWSKMEFDTSRLDYPERGTLLLMVRTFSVPKMHFQSFAYQILVPLDKITEAVSIVLDRANHPILIHCNKGKVCWAREIPMTFYAYLRFSLASNGLRCCMPKKSTALGVTGHRRRISPIFMAKIPNEWRKYYRRLGRVAVGSYCHKLWWLDRWRGLRSYNHLRTGSVHNKLILPYEMSKSRQFSQRVDMKCCTPTWTNSDLQKVPKIC